MVSHDRAREGAIWAYVDAQEEAERARRVKGATLAAQIDFRRRQANHAGARRRWLEGLRADLNRADPTR